MQHDLNHRLAQAATAAQRKERLIRRVQELTAEHRQAVARADQLRRQLAREEQDVTRLEGLSLTGLFYSVLGSKEEQLQQERQEALAAQLKYDEAMLTVSGLAGELEQARQDLKAAEADAAAYPSLLKAKEELISRGTGQASDQLFLLSERQRAVDWELLQVKEAQSAGHTAAAALSRVADSLRSAQGWGTWDMLGGGLIATAVKHSRMDDARSHAHHAQQALAAFRRELKDVALNLDAGQVGVDGFTRFADFFFDGLIVDWVVQSRINNSLHQVEQTQRQVRQVMASLETREREARANLTRIQQERDAFIAGCRD